jgi:2-phospho-L-lactate guanylyltransferase
VQGTIKTFDTESRTGDLLTDDAREVRITPLSLEGSELLLLRVGQRVDFELAEEGGQNQALSMKIPTF